jgi:alanyl-tRNA synthetase
MRDRLAAIRKAFDKETKEKEAAINKAAVEAIQTFFKEQPNAQVYFADVPGDGNVKVRSGLHFFL